MIEVVRQARQRQVPRVPFVIDGRQVGSVALAHLPALAGFGEVLEVDPDRVVLRERRDREHWLAEINQALREQGLVRAWRDEIFAVVEPQTQRVITRIERAACRFWGLLTFGAHANGFVRDAAGAVGGLWIARRSATKATDPGCLDNLIGGGVPEHQSPQEALQREAWEEAGLPPALAARAREQTVLELDRDIPEGLQFERLHAFDLELPHDFVPRNQDGEVAAFMLLTPPQVQAELGAGTMTVDAALVTLDFLLRHALVDAAVAPALQQALDPLRRR